MATVFYRGFYRKIENLRLQCAWSGEVTGKNSKKSSYVLLAWLSLPCDVWQSPVSGTGKMALFFKLCATMLFRFAQRRPSDRCRWSSSDLYFSLWKNSDTRSPQLRREERWPFFLDWEQFLSVEVIEEEMKASKRKSSSDGWIEESRKKSHRQLWSTRVHE